jgi:predicted ester cyclase
MASTRPSRRLTAATLIEPPSTTRHSGPPSRNHDPTAPEVPAGPEGVRRLVELYRAAFPDLHFEHEDVISLGERVAHRWTFTGTHGGEIMGIEPTET